MKNVKLKAKKKRKVTKTEVIIKENARKPKKNVIMAG